MTHKRWRQVEEIFQTAVERDGAERDNYLTEACGADADLRSEVESLLAHEITRTLSGQPFQQAIKGAARSLTIEQIEPKEPGDTLIGWRIGVYRVTSLIGRGGMGAVYLAERDDSQFNQQVAVKIIKRGMDTDFIRDRFLRERQILAGLDHPHIARLLDGGTTKDGLPYFVMEHVAGVSITDYCEVNKLSIAERLNLFRQVCAAVQHAHQKLVVHRDLKPSNILVNRDGAPKLLDFGVAKLLAPDSDGTRTRTEQRMLTPDYASPEQVRGQTITTAADIYSLGVVLYELLTHRRPHEFKTASPAEIERAICETEPAKPSDAVSFETVSAGKMQKQLAGDLDNIVLMAMRKEPERRYQSVEQFSEDIRRHLDGLPVTARADTFTYRAGKFVRRHRFVVAAAALVALSLLGGIVTTTRQARLARAERARAERRFDQVRKLSNTFLFDFHKEIQNLPGSTRARELAVKTALEYLDSLAQEAADDPALQLELAQAYEKVGSVQGNPNNQNRGDSAAALVSYRKAMSIYNRLLANDPSNQRLLGAIAYLHLSLGLMYSETGRNAETEQSYRETIRLVEKMTAARMDVDPYLVATTHNRLGEMARRTGDLHAALEHQRRGFAFISDWIAKHPKANPQGLWITGYVRLGAALLHKGDLEEALEANQQALRINEEQAASNPINIDARRGLISRHQGVAAVLGDPDDLNLGRPDEALMHFRKALALAEELAAIDPNNAQDKRAVARGAMYVAMMLRDSKPAEAAALYRKSLLLSEALYQASPENVEFRHTLALANRGLAYTLWRLGNPQEALPGLRKALEYQLANFAKDPQRTWSHRNIRRTYAVIGDLLLQHGDTDGALDHYRQAMEITEKLLAIHPHDPYLRRDEAYCYESFGQFHAALAASQRLPRGRRIAAAREAIKWYQRSLQIWDGWLAQGVATAYAAIRRNEAARALAQCDAAISRPITFNRNFFFE
jgi:serine/threonine protein kinase